MKATADTVWSVPAYLPYIQPDLTDEAVVNAESTIGYKLPNEYIALLRVQNGGYIRFTLPDIDADHRVIAGIGPRYPSLTDEFDHCVQGIVEFDGDGHWLLGLDYREDSTEPSVTFIDFEYDKQSTVADSFAGYLSQLRLSVGEEEYVVFCDPESVASHIGRYLNVTFETPDSWAHGYPVWRFGRAIEGIPHWIWIGPNSVPRTFARREDSGIARLDACMKGEADRFPGVPSAACILNATESLIADVLEACEQSGLAYRPLRDYFPANGVS